MTRGARRVFRLMRDGRWHDSAEIEQACQVTAHSRLAELRGEGCVFEKRSNRGATGRHKFSYRLEVWPSSLEQLAGAVGAGAASCSSDVDGSAHTHASEGTGEGSAEVGSTASAEPLDAEVTAELEDGSWREMFPPALAERVERAIGEAA